MLRQSLKKREFNLFLNQLNIFPFTIAVQFDYKITSVSEIQLYVPMKHFKSRLKIPSFFLTWISRSRLFTTLKGSTLFFIKLSEASLFNFLKEKSNFNIIFIPMYNSNQNFCNIYSNTIISYLRINDFWNVQHIILSLIKKYILFHLSLYNFSFRNLLILLYNKK